VPQLPSSFLSIVPSLHLFGCWEEGNFRLRRPALHTLHPEALNFWPVGSGQNLVAPCGEIQEK